tara:strand:- start:30829 stop:37440 length:6612 start_codon:yes stop_codon:yes gene_type:complete
MGSFVRIIKSDEKKGEKKGGPTQKGFDALQKYMNEAEKKYLDKDNKFGIFSFFDAIIYANNHLLANALGYSGLTEKDTPRSIHDEREDDNMSLGEEPLINAPVMLHLKQLIAKHPELQEARDKDEEINGSLEDAMAGMGGIRPDISAFIAEPYNKKRFAQENEIKGIHNLFEKYMHPIAPTITADAKLAGSQIQPNIKRRKPQSRVRVAGPMTDTSFEDEMNRLVQEQKENMEFKDDKRFKYGGEKQQRAAEDYYDKFFSQTDIDRGPKAPASVSVRRPQTQETRALETKHKDLMREFNLDKKAAFAKIQDDFNNFMISLTGNKAFGTSGRAGKFGAEIEVGRTPDAITPSMNELGRSLGIGMQAPNIPDFIGKRWREEADPFSMNLREEITEQLSDETSNQGFHPTLLTAMGEEGLLSTLYGDPNVQVVDPGFIGGDQEEKETRAKEARRSEKGGAETESALMTPEDEIKVLRGKRKLTPSQKIQQLERQLNIGDIDDYDYKMQIMAMDLDGRHLLDPDAKLGGLTGDDFDVNHPLHGKNEDDLIASTDTFVDGLIGMGRIIRDLRYEAYKHSEGKMVKKGKNKKPQPLTKQDIDDKIAALKLDADNIVAFGKPKEERTKEENARYKTLDDLMNGKLSAYIPRLTSTMSYQQKMLNNLGLNPIDIINAAIKYANADMTTTGYNDAFTSLLASQMKDGTLNTYPIKRLLNYLKDVGYRRALDEEYHAPLMEQKEKFRKNHEARQIMKEEYAKTKSKKTEESDAWFDPNHEHAEDVVHDKEECLACHPDRFGNRTAKEAYARGPRIPTSRGRIRSIKSPFAHKSVVVPSLTGYSKGNKSGFLPAVAPKGSPSLAAIANHIFPNKYDIDDLLDQEKTAREEKRVRAWAKDIQKRMKREIKDAVITGNPRAANIYKKFGLSKTLENPLATGPAGMSNKELTAASFFLNNDDATDKHYEKVRSRNLLATRYNAIEDALSFMRELTEGAYGKKIKAGALAQDSYRRDTLKDMISQPLSGIEKQESVIKRNEIEKATYKKQYARYLKEQANYENLLAETKMVKYKDEDGIERERRGKFGEPAQIAIIKDMGQKIKKEHGNMLAIMKEANKKIEKAKKKIDRYKDKSNESIERANKLMLGAFIMGGEELANFVKNPEKMTEREVIENVYNKLYADSPSGEYDSIITADMNGNIGYDKTHSLSKYKDGRLGQMAGTGIRFNINNKAMPRISSEMQLIAHRMKNGFPLSEEQIAQANAMMDDAENADDSFDDEAINEAIANLSLEELADVNMSELRHHHHDSNEDELGLLSEEEAARRELNSHFTREAEEAIARGDFASADQLISNWRQHAPTLCGTCHGHRFVTRDEAKTYLRHHIPELRDEPMGSPRFDRYIADNLRPRNSASFAGHAMADDMEDGEHEQLACPSCNHSADYVRGGQLCNGICSECGGSGIRDPDDEAHLYEGYTDKEGNKIDGKNHHYTHNGAVDAKFDFLNSIMLQSAQASIGGHEMPAGMLAPTKPLWQMYGDATDSGKFRTLEELREARKKKELPEIEIDEDAPEFQGVPTEQIDPARTEEIRQKRLAEKLTSQPTKPKPEIKLPTVHNTATNNHNKLMLENHINKLARMALAGQGDAPQFRSEFKGLTSDDEEIYEQVPIDVKQQINDLVNEIKAHPAFINGDVHGNTEHHLLEKIHELQEMAEAPFVDDLSDVMAGKAMKRKDRNKLIAQRRRLPVDEKGNISLTAADVFGGNSPMTFGDFQSLYPAHGRMLTMKEIREGVFEPGATHAPSDITDEDLKRLFAGNRKAQGVIKRRERVNDYSPEAMQSIVDVFDKIKRPMTRRKTTNLTSSALNDLLRNYGEKEMVGEMEDHHLTYSDETMKAIADSDITKSKVNNLLTSANADGKQRPLNSRYTMGLNMAIREMWQKYAIMSAMNVFMREINNPLEFPKIPQSINQNNFQDLTREDSALYELMHDEAAKLLGYDDYSHFEKKFNLKKTAQITGGRGNIVQEIKPSEFKDSVMANAKHSDEGEFPIGYEELKRDEDGEIESKFVPSMASAILTRARNSLITPADQQMYDVMKKVGNYHEAPNWHHRNEINNIIKGEEDKEDGFANYEELRQAHANNALPPELAKQITTSFMLSYLSHPTLSLQNHSDMLKYEHAVNEGQAATPPVQPAPQVAPYPFFPPPPQQPLQFYQYGVGPRTIGGDENSQ